MTMEIRFEMPVARETPSTDIPNAMTKTRFSTTLSRPVMVRTISGVLVSPLARKMAMRKFVTEMNGTPMK